MRIPPGGHTSASEHHLPGGLLTDSPSEEEDRGGEH
jgi:hypothetical protein